MAGQYLRQRRGRQPWFALRPKTKTDESERGRGRLNEKAYWAKSRSRRALRRGDFGGGNGSSLRGTWSGKRAHDAYIRSEELGALAASKTGSSMSRNTASELSDTIFDGRRCN